MNERPFKLGLWEKVQKRHGYKFPGVIVSRYRTLKTHEPRYVVECTAKGAEGCQHIFSEDQLKRRTGHE